MGDFNYAILNDTAHRPWPMPDAPWLMTQTWHDLLFAHWPVSADILREKVPPGFPLDLFEGQAWLGIVPFRMSNVAPRLMPAVPMVSAFPELNVRTYVTVEGKPGVFFFSLDAGSAIAVGAARTLLRLPYFSAEMTVTTGDGWIHYNSRRRETGGEKREARLAARYRPVEDPQPPLEGSLEYFLTERYCLYAVDHAYRPYRLDIHHPRWPLQTAEAEITVNTMADAAGIPLPSIAPLLHYSTRQDMVAWGPRRI